MKNPKLPSSIEEGDAEDSSPRRGWLVRRFDARRPQLSRTTPAAAIGCCQPLLVQGGELLTLLVPAYPTKRLVNSFCPWTSVKRWSRP